MQNSSKSALEQALIDGKVFYKDGSFQGKFSAEISKELRKLGAVFSKDKWKLPSDKVPTNFLAASLQGQLTDNARITKLLDNLLLINPDRVAEKSDIDLIAKKTVEQVSKMIDGKINNIKFDSQFDAQQTEQITKNYVNQTKRHIKDYTQSEVERIRKFIQEKVKEGKRSENIYQELGQRFNMLPKRAQFIAKQETQLMNAEMQKQKYVKAGFHRYIWTCRKAPVGFKKGNVRPDHHDLDGQIFSWNDPPIIDHKTGRRGHPGEDFNCFPSNIDVFCPVDEFKIYRRSFAGDLVSIVTANGPLDATPNHPILTSRGWVSAKDIQIGDNIFHVGNDGFFAREGNPYYMKTKFDELFGFFNVLFDSVRLTMPTVHFHGDISINNEVEIITTNCELRNHIKTKASHSFLNSIFSDSDKFLTGVELPSNGSFLFFGHTYTPSSSCIMRSLGKIFSILFRSEQHSVEHGLAAISWVDSILDKVAIDDGARDIELFRKSFDAKSRIIKFYQLAAWEIYCVVRRSLVFDKIESLGADRLGEIARGNSLLLSNLTEIESIGIKSHAVINKLISKNFSGHVYNLESKNNWYFANGFIVHNCRCSVKPIIE